MQLLFTRLAPVPFTSWPSVFNSEFIGFVLGGRLQVGVGGCGRVWVQVEAWLLLLGFDFWCAWHDTVEVSVNWSCIFKCIILHPRGRGCGGLVVVIGLWFLMCVD